MKSQVIIVILGLLILVGLGGYYFLANTTEYTSPETDMPSNTAPVIDDTPIPVEPDGGIGDGRPLDEVNQITGPIEVIGQSAGGKSITAYHYGTGESELLFVGGIHGGYSGNTVVVAEELMAYLEANPEVIPDNLMVTVVPVMNPDGLETVYEVTSGLGADQVITDVAATTPGRFNGNNVDLNRNFDCEWDAEGTWQNRTVSGGAEPFSEPEARAIRDYVETHDIVGAVVWYSAAGGVYSSSCNNGVSPETKAITNLYASAAGYEAFEEFDFYEITGDMVNWFAKSGIPAISVLLTDHRSSEWSKNRQGVQALLNYYAE